ncbi:MAG: hypothetical protein ACE365_07910 [Gammaproteobacteria bacterium]
MLSHRNAKSDTTASQPSQTNHPDRSAIDAVNEHGSYIINVLRYSKESLFQIAKFHNQENPTIKLLLETESNLTYMGFEYEDRVSMLSKPFSKQIINCMNHLIPPHTLPDDDINDIRNIITENDDVIGFYIAFNQMLLERNVNPGDYFYDKLNEDFSYLSQLNEDPEVCEKMTNEELIAFEEEKERKQSESLTEKETQAIYSFGFETIGNETVTGKKNSTLFPIDENQCTSEEPGSPLQKRMRRDLST